MLDIDKLDSYGAAESEIMPGVEHRYHLGRPTEQKITIRQPDSVAHH